MELTVQIPGEALDRLADLIAERLLDQLPTGGGVEVVSATELADRLGRSREWVYDHAADLGAVRLGSRLSFEWPACWKRFKEAQDKNARTASEGSIDGAEPVATGRRSSSHGCSAGTQVTLLPVKGPGDL